MQTKLQFGKVKCKLNEQLLHVLYPLNDNTHKAVLPSHWSHYLVLLSHSTWHSTADTHQLHFAGKMAKICSYMNLLPIGEDNNLNIQNSMRAVATGIWRTTHRRHQYFLTYVPLITNKDLQQGSSLPDSAILRQQGLFPSAAADLV